MRRNTVDMHKSIAIRTANVLLLAMPIRLFATTRYNVIRHIWNVSLKLKIGETPRIYFVIGWFNIDFLL